MRLSIFFILLASLQTLALNNFAQGQKFNLKVENRKISEVLKLIESESGYFLFYNNKVVNLEEVVSLNLTNKSVIEVLDVLFVDKDIIYTINDKQIVLSKKVGKAKKLDSIQQKGISGKVTDDTGQTLPGVTVIIKGTTIGTITNADGNYSLSNVSGDVTLVFSFVGMRSQEIFVGKASVYNVVMEEDLVGIGEVVVVGYGEQKRTDVTGAIASVHSESIQHMSSSSLDSRLQGMVSGVNIYSTSSEPGGNLNIRIRGANSISANNNPLIVLDGYPLPENTEATALGGGSDMPLNVLSAINPDDIESFEVLKDASATAIYGSRGANGVIVVTTKQGTRNKYDLSFTTEQMFSPIPEMFTLMSGPQYAEWKNWLKPDDPPFTDLEGYAGLPENQSTTDWLQEISQIAYSQKYNLTFRGGNDKTTFFLSCDYRDQNGIVINSKYQQGNIRANITSDISNRLKVSLGFNYNRTNASRRELSSDGLDYGGPIWRSFRASPTILPYDDEGFLQEDDPVSGAYYANPLSEARDLYDRTNNENTLVNIKLDYKIMHGMDLILSAGSNNTNSIREQFWPFNVQVGNRFNGRGLYNTAHTNDYRFEPYVNYSKSFQGHFIQLTGGYTFTTNVRQSTAYISSDFPTDELGTNALQLGQEVNVRDTYKSGRDLSSVYYRANYNFRSKYYLSLTGRYDGSSVFPIGNQWKFFPAVSGGWTLSNESFMQDFAFLNNLKLRASYGITGSQSVPSYSSMTLLEKMNYGIGDVEVAGQGLTTKLGNSDLVWESTNQADIGLDLSVFNNRISFVADVYKKATTGLLQSLKIPPSSGFTFTTANMGSIENLGFELGLNAVVLKGEQYSWSSSLNFAKNKTDVKDLGGPDIIIEGNILVRNIFDYPTNIMQEGIPYGAFKGYLVDGLIQESDFDADGNPTFAMFNNEKTLGSWKYIDVVEDGVISESDRVIIGDPSPDFTFGWNNTFTYKRFSLSALIYGSIGFDVINATNAFVRSGFDGSNQLQEWYEKRWTPDNQHNDPKYPSYTSITNMELNDQMVEDGSFVRLKNVSFSYQLPNNMLRFIDNAKVYVTATDLVTITNYSGFDPEVNVRGRNNIVQNVDLGSYPRTKSFMIGMKLGF